MCVPIAYNTAITNERYRGASHRPPDRTPEGTPPPVQLRERTNLGPVREGGPAHGADAHPGDHCEHREDGPRKAPGRPSPAVEEQPTQAKVVPNGRLLFVAPFTASDENLFVIVRVTDEDLPLGCTGHTLR